MMIRRMWSAKAAWACAKTSVWGASVVILLSVTTAHGARADTSTFTNDLAQLENCFFDHDYKNDDDSTRLNRLEKFVFGEVRSGSESQRITKLLLAMPPDKKKADKGSPTVTSSDKSEDDSVAVPEDLDAKGSDDSQDQRIANLEQQVLGKTYSGESASKRVTRLEKTKFGHSTGGGNVDDRLSILEAYAKTPNAPSQTEGPTYQTPEVTRSEMPQSEMSESEMSQSEIPQEESRPTGIRSGPSPELPSSVNREVGSLVQRVGAMEVTVFGHKNTKLPLPERIQRLEKEIGVDSGELAQKDLPTQVDSLWSQVGSASSSSKRKVGTQMVPSDSYASGSLSDFSEQGDQNWDGTQNPNAHQSWLHKLGKAIGGIGSLAAGALMTPSFSPYGYGYGGYPYSPYGMYGNSYMNPYSPWGGGGYYGGYPGLGGYGGYGGGYGGYYPHLGTYGWGGSPFGGFGGSPFGGFGGSPFGGGNSFIHF